MTGWIAALRIARREARKAKGRSVLVLAMIGLPVAFLSFAAASYDMFTLTAEEKLERQLGSADALITWQTRGEVRQSPQGWQQYDGQAVPATIDDEVSPGHDDLMAALPPGSRVVRIGNIQLKAKTPDGITYIEGKAADIDDPLLRGMVHLLEGTAPSGPDQVAVNAAAAQRLDVGLGGTITTFDPDRTFVVKAIIEYPDRLNPLVAFPADALKAADPQGYRAWLVDTPAPVDWEMVKRLNRKGMIVASRAVILDPPATEHHIRPGSSEVEDFAPGGMIAGLAIVEIVLLAGPAFAVGARRRAHDLAIVAASGGEPKHLRRIVLADGVVLGLVGALIGTCLGVALALAGRPILEEHVTLSRAGGYRIFPLALIGILALAVGIGALAAAVPAFTAARQNVAQALTGRRGIVRSRKRWIAVGVAITGTGMVIAVLGALGLDDMAILAGVILAELGLVLLTPALIGLIAKVGRWLPLAPRLALRDTARNRSSTAPAISAIMAAVAGAVAVGVFVSGQERQYIDRYQPSLPMGHLGISYYSPDAEPDWAKLEAAVRGVLPAADVHIYRMPACPGELGTRKFRCDVRLVTPPENRCPYDLLAANPQRALSEKERDAASGDDKCDRNLPVGHGPFGGILVDDGAAIPALTKADPADVRKAGQVLARGGVVVTDPRYFSDGTVTLEILTGKENAQADIRTVAVEGYVLPSGTPGMRAIVSAAAMELAKLDTQIVGLIAATAMPTQAQEDRLNAEVQQILGPDAWLNVERGPRPPRDPIGLILALAAAAMALAAAGIATGLTATETRADLGTLAAVGGAPRVRRLLSLSQAGVISGLGAALGTATGLGAAALTIFMLNRLREQQWMQAPPFTFGMPWDTVAIIVAVPLLAMAGAGLMTRSRLPIERRL